MPTGTVMGTGTGIMTPTQGTRTLTSTIIDGPRGAHVGILANSATHPTKLASLQRERIFQKLLTIFPRVGCFFEIDREWPGGPRAEHDSRHVGLHLRIQRNL